MMRITTFTSVEVLSLVAWGYWDGTVEPMASVVTDVLFEVLLYWNLLEVVLV